MDLYVTQLLEMLQEAKQNRPSPRYWESPEYIDDIRFMIDLEMLMHEEEYTMESIFGIEQIYLPPENRLSDEQICLLIYGIVDLWREFHYDPVFREGEFTEREQYTKLVNCWKETYPIIREENRTCHIELYDQDRFWDEEKQRYLSDEEFSAIWTVRTKDFKFDENEEQPF